MSDINIDDFDPSDVSIETIEPWMLRSAGYFLIALAHDKDENSNQSGIWFGRAVQEFMMQAMAGGEFSDVFERVSTETDTREESDDSEDQPEDEQT